ncbi:MAG TPA: phosphoribosylformylglycinamidine synthase, partial [bacterium]|nr:phosphoribosylformylglycinamidine synthase [bacterium]
MIHRIEILTAPRHADPVGRSLLARIRQFSDLPLEALRTCAVYSFADEALAGNGGNGGSALDAAALRALGAELFADPVLHQVCVDGEGLRAAPFDWYVEVGFRPGVTDNVGRTAQESLEYRLGHPLAEGHHVHTATGYFFRGALSRAQVQALADEWLANELIQQTTVLAPDEAADTTGEARARLFHLPRVELHQPIRVERFALERAETLLALSAQRLLALSPPEAEAIRAYYARPDVIAARRAVGLGPEATDVELEVLAQTWSEHCKHKIFNADIAYTDESGRSETIRSLYKTYIQGATATVRAAQGDAD